VLEWLREYGLYTNSQKCNFVVTEVGFLGFVIGPDVILMESDRISIEEDWPTPQSVCHVQGLLGFTNHYQRFIRKYGKVTTQISDLLKKAERSRMPKQLKWEWTQDAELAFQKFKSAFTDAPILNQFHPARQIILQTNARGFALAVIVN